jgi:hypothetical protein
MARYATRRFRRDGEVVSARAVWFGMIAVAAALTLSTPGLAQTDGQDDTMQTAQAPPAPIATDPVSDYFAHWFQRVDQAQSEQPHWMTPVATVTPRLEEEVRYDQLFENLGGKGGYLENFDGGKGLELIPFDPVEVILGVPPYIRKDVPGQPSISGFNDYPFMLVKYRLFSANEQNGNYILTMFLQGSAPTGIAALTSNSYMITPTIAGGFGLGDFDVQMTLGESFPTEHTDTGNVISWNTTLQYHLLNVIWPEIEFNWTHFSGGERSGLNQAFVTPGVIFGRFPLFDRVKLIVGVGYQFAVEPQPTIPKPLTPMYHDNFILTTRFAF